MSPDDSWSAFDEDPALHAEQARLLDVAFRMLGSSAEASHAVDQTFQQWQASASAEDHVDDLARRDRLTEILARTCFEHLRQARTGREGYVGEWLPEPIPHPAPGARNEVDATPEMPAQAHPADRVSLDESLNMLLLVVLETLTPEERVAFILHDVFGVAFKDIADVVGRSWENTRQLADSARAQIQRRRKHQEPRHRHRRVVLDLLVGCEAGDGEAVRATLASGVIVHIDGGGRVEVDETPVHGKDEVSGLLLRLFAGACVVSATEQSVNGHSGLVFRQAKRVISVLSAHAVAGAIVEIWIVANPDKLRHWNSTSE